MFSRNVFGERIKQLRIDKKVNQIELANLLGVTRTQISDIENGKTTTSIERLYALAEYFSCSSDFLLGLKTKEDLEDEYLLAIATERLKNDTGARISFEEHLAKRGLTFADIEKMEDVEIE